MIMHIRSINRGALQSVRWHPGSLRADVNWRYARALHPFLGPRRDGHGFLGQLAVVSDRYAMSDIMLKRRAASGGS